jgi:hypothetical protein
VVPADSQAPGAIPSRVRVVEPLGSHVLVTVTIEGTEFKVLAASDFTPAEDAVLWLRPAPEKVRWFDPDTQREVQPERDPAGSRPLPGRRSNQEVARAQMRRAARRKFTTFST